MPDAYIKYRSGGGFQKVLNYDYVLDVRKLIESGWFRDGGYVPSVIIEDQHEVDSVELTTMGLGYGSTSQYVNAVHAAVDVGSATTTTGLIGVAPDEMMHTAPRQLSYYETSLTFLANSSVTDTAAGDNSGGNLRITVFDSSLFAGRPVLFAGASLPGGIYPYQIYYPVALSATTMLLQTSIGGAFVAWTSDGAGSITVLDQLACFQWANILGWSNTAPSR